MSKCPASNRKLVNFFTCDTCSVNFHEKCLNSHKHVCQAPTQSAQLHAPLSNISGINMSDPSVDASQHLASLYTVCSSANNLNHLQLPSFETAPALPPDWDTLDINDKLSRIMINSEVTKKQNEQIITHLAQLTQKVNFQSDVINANDSSLKTLDSDVSDIHNALLDRTPTTEIIITGIPKQMQLEPNQIAKQVLDFIDLPFDDFKTHILEVRPVKQKGPLSTYNSIILDCVSHRICEKIIQFAARKRRVTPLSARIIFNLNVDSIIYINHMLSPYYQQLAYQARQQKKALNWKSSWVNNSNIYIKKTDSSRPSRIATTSQLNKFK